MLAGYSHSSFTVSDLDRSLDFYVNTLGMVMGHRWERVSPDIVGVYISDPDGATIELVEAVR